MQDGRGTFVSHGRGKPGVAAPVKIVIGRRRRHLKPQLSPSAPPSGMNCGNWKEGTMSRNYEIHSGRRIVKTVRSSSSLQAAIDYVHTFGSAKEITILGPDTVSWRGARFVGVPVNESSSEAELPVLPA